MKRLKKGYVKLTRDELIDHFIESFPEDSIVEYFLIQGTLTAEGERVGIRQMESLKEKVGKEASDE